MNYITTKQAATKWNITPDRVLKLIKNGRIPDAVQIGYRWMIPDSTDKPGDGRTREVRKTLNGTNGLFRYPGFEGCDPDSFNPPLSPVELTIKKASEAFYACRFEDVVELLPVILKQATEKYHYIYYLYISCMICIFQNRIKEYFDYYSKLTAELHTDFPRKIEMSALIHEIDATLGMTGYFVNEFNIDPLYTYHDSYSVHLANLCMVSLFYSESSSISKKDLIPYEYICKSIKGSGNNVDRQSIHLYLFLLYETIGERDNGFYHCCKALEIAQQYELYYLPAILYYYYETLFNRVLAGFSVEFREHLYSLSADIHKRYCNFMDSASSDSGFYHLLSQKDYTYVFLTVQGYTNKEIAGLLKVSQTTVNNTLNKIYSKLKVQDKSGLRAYYNKVTGSCGAFQK